MVYGGVVCRVNSSLLMKSLTLWPSGAERWRITLHLPFSLGTTPNPEVLRFPEGRRGNGPRTLPARTSVSSSASMASGCDSVEAGLIA